MIKPEYIGVKDWFSSLNIDYPNDVLPRLVEDDQWQEIGEIISGIGVFGRGNIPSPFDIDISNGEGKYKSWVDWAREVYLIMTALSTNEANQNQQL